MKVFSTLAAVLVSLQVAVALPTDTFPIAPFYQLLGFGNQGWALNDSTAPQDNLTIFEHVAQSFSNELGTEISLLVPEGALTTTLVDATINTSETTINAAGGNPDGSSPLAHAAFVFIAGVSTFNNENASEFKALIDAAYNDGIRNFVIAGLPAPAQVADGLMPANITVDLVNKYNQDLFDVLAARDQNDSDEGFYVFVDPTLVNAGVPYNNALFANLIVESVREEWQAC